jgi:hypothetical protein
MIKVSFCSAYANYVSYLSMRAPDAVMMLSIIIGLSVLPIILLFIREPKTRER